MLDGPGAPGWVRRVATPSAETRAAVRSALGKEPVAFHAPHTGLSPTERLIVGFDDGTSVFVKAATDATAAALRIENEILSCVAADFVPRRLAWCDGDRPLLVVEDLSAAHWPADHHPVTWKPGQHELLFATLRGVAQAAPPPSLRAAQEGFEPCWPTIVAADADAFLALGLCSAVWLRDAHQPLIGAEAGVPLAGDALVHHDVRSDNLCFVGDRVVLVDWAEARRGHPEHDLATLLPTLPLEGGPEPYDVMPHGGAWASFQAARIVRHVLRGSATPDAPSGAPPAWLRKVLLRLTAICLSWAARSLDLPEPDGRSWREIA